ncbi:MAG: sugar porter family MFS transporter [Bacteroidota bacterium]
MAIIASASVVSVSEKFDYNRRYIFLVSTITALGGLLFGYDLANISGTIHFFTNYFALDEFHVGWAVGCISVGAAAGAMISGKLSDILGRRRILLLSAVLFAVTGIGTGWAENFTLFIIFRISSGVAIGCATVVCPIYIAEISPASLRGRLVAYYQLAITLGVLLAYFSNYLLLGTGVNNWRWMFSSQSAPAILFLTGLFFVPESPRWLLMKKREPEAKHVLQKIGGNDFAEREIAAIHLSFSNIIKENISNLFGKNFLHVIITGIGIAIFSQIGGPFTAYAPEIFKDAGVAQDSAFLQSVIIGVILFIFTLVAIATVEKAGRRYLLLYGAALLLLDTLALALAFYFQLSGIWILVFALIFTAIYAATVGPVSWVLLAEIFPNRIRGNAMSIATLSLWIANFLNTASFPILKAKFGMPVTFGIYVPLFLIFLFFVYIRVPETKGKSLEEIEKMLTKKDKTGDYSPGKEI